MDTLDKIDKFLETYNLSKLNQEESKNLYRPITTNEIKAVIKKLPANKSPGPNGFTGKFYQTFKELTLFLSNYSKIFKGRLPKPDKDTTKKKNI